MFHYVRRISLLEQRAFMKLHQYVQPKSPKTWDSSTFLEGTETTVLRAAYADCMANSVSPHFARQYPSSDSAIALVATDASMAANKDGADGTQGGTGFVHSLAGSPGRIVIRNGRHNYDKIVIAELSVVLEAMLAIDRAHDDAGIPRVAMFVFAIDSMSAKGMIERGFSRNDAANDILKKIFDQLAGRWCFTDYVHTKLNPADEGSRGDDFVPSKWTALLPALQKLAKYSVASAVCADVTREARRRQRGATEGGAEM